jgi:immunity protein, SdpI family
MRRWLPASFIIAACAFSIAVFSRLPERVPVHWGLNGEPNRYGSRLEGAFFGPLLMIVLYLLLQWYPSRDPRAGNIAKFRATYDLVVAATILFLGVMHVLALSSSLGLPVEMSTVALVGLGGLMLLLGNLLPRARSNFIFGIRTPWTLSSDTVWTRSHRVGGYAMVAAGLLTILSAFVARPLGLTIALVSLIIAGLIPVVYSYVLWSREHRPPSNETP